jgi:hypothetical protein
MRKETTMRDQCINCKFFENDPAFIEAAFPGLNSLSSAYGSVRAEAGICSQHDLFLAPWKQCADFESREGKNALIPVEKKLTGWRISLGIVLLGILAWVSYAFFPTGH